MDNLLVKCSICGVWFDPWTVANEMKIVPVLTVDPRTNKTFHGKKSVWKHKRCPKIAAGEDA